jgi:hypothetical protein
MISLSVRRDVFIVLLSVKLFAYITQLSQVRVCIHQDNTPHSIEKYRNPSKSLYLQPGGFVSLRFSFFIAFSFIVNINTKTLAIMIEYNSLKVPDLKKLLGERSLPISGNKSDLIARLQEHDKKPISTAGA